MISVWIFDDLWEEGYRFDDIITKRYCFVPKEFAKNENMAFEFLETAFKFIPKIQGTSKRLNKSEQVLQRSLVIVE